MGAKEVARHAKITIVEGEAYEHMRAKAYGWGSAIPVPIYFENKPLPIEPRREATPEEVDSIYRRKAVKRFDNKVDVPKPAAKTEPAMKAEPATDPDPIGMLTQKERTVIIAWRQGNKAEAAKIILND